MAPLAISIALFSVMEWAQVPHHPRLSTDDDPPPPYTQFPAPYQSVYGVARFSAAAWPVNLDADLDGEGTERIWFNPNPASSNLREMGPTARHETLQWLCGMWNFSPMSGERRLTFGQTRIAIYPYPFVPGPAQYWSAANGASSSLREIGPSETPNTLQALRDMWNGLFVRGLASVVRMWRVVVGWSTELVLLLGFTGTDALDGV
ncbi:unnamed protein product [Peniophora sp. CBMAI 1063]|nr:unnamed protein product [Peniophora sp. CBMAI 1063]